MRRRFTKNPPRRAAQAVGAGFTLIELLVVVAIISILASIATPNFLEAQIRAKIVRMANDMRVVGDGLETYKIDNSRYPPRTNDPKTSRPWPSFQHQAADYARLTTPIGYVVQPPRDILDKSNGIPAFSNNRFPYYLDYFDPYHVTYLLSLNMSEAERRNFQDWALISVGPDGYIGATYLGTPGGYPRQPVHVPPGFVTVYDPTNGSTSIGNLFRISGGRDATAFFSRR